MKLLQSVTYSLPLIDSDFTKKFINYLGTFGTIEGDNLLLTNTSKEYSPLTRISFTEVEIPTVTFAFNVGEPKVIKIVNETGKVRESPHSYKALSISEYLFRVAEIKTTTIDHTGFNLPYFSGIHPTILEMRSLLKDTSFYHTFPKEFANEPWDFILPATEIEILQFADTEYTAIRRPKIELVSFDKTSTPLIQIDLQLEVSYERLKELFPEAIDIPDIKCLWVYIENNFGIDICFVLNETQADWSYYFKGNRLVQT